MIFFQMTKMQPKNTPTIFLYGIKMINCINILSEKYQRCTPTKIMKYKGHFIKEYTNSILILYYEISVQSQRYIHRVLQTIQMKLILLWVWAEPAVLGRAKTALKFKYEI